MRKKQHPQHFIKQFETLYIDNEHTNSIDGHEAIAKHQIHKMATVLWNDVQPQRFTLGYQFDLYY